MCYYPFAHVSMCYLPICPFAHVSMCYCAIGPAAHATCCPCYLLSILPAAHANPPPSSWPPTPLMNMAGSGNLSPYPMPILVPCTTPVKSLPMDHALLTLTSPSSSPATTLPTVSYVYGDCYKCSSKQVSLPTVLPACYSVPTSYDTVFEFTCRASDTTMYSSYTLSPVQFGEYTLQVTMGSESGAALCATQLTHKQEPSLGDNGLPLILLACYILILSLLRYVYLKRYKKASTPQHPPQLFAPLLINNRAASTTSNASSHHSHSTSPIKRPRILSLDTFRGLSLCLMIFVNLGGGGYFFFNHSTWNGLTVADLLFPWFVWIMGVTGGATFRQLPSLSKSGAKFKAAFWRSLKLFALGLLLNSNGNGGDLTTLRIPGVLQVSSEEEGVEQCARTATHMCGQRSCSMLGRTRHLQARSEETRPQRFCGHVAQNTLLIARFSLHASQSTLLKARFSNAPFDAMLAASILSHYCPLTLAPLRA